MDKELLNNLASKAIKYSGINKSELEKGAWFAVHEHIHGFTPVEYDIREVDENLYETVLNAIKVKGK